MTRPNGEAGAVSERPALPHDDLPHGVTARVVYVARDGSEHSSVRFAAEKNEDIARADRANELLEGGASIWEAAKAWSPFPSHQPPAILQFMNKDTPLIISHWQCRDNPGYTVNRFENDGYYIYVGGDAGSWSGSYGNKITLLDLARYAADTLTKHPNLSIEPTTTPTTEPQP